MLVDLAGNPFTINYYTLLNLTPITCYTQIMIHIPSLKFYFFFIKRKVTYYFHKRITN